MRIMLNENVTYLGLKGPMVASSEEGRTNERQQPRESFAFVANRRWWMEGDGQGLVLLV